jgi:hypothetical protein
MWTSAVKVATESVHGRGVECEELKAKKLRKKLTQDLSIFAENEQARRNFFSSWQILKEF